jgi:hypothetical protein
LCRLSKILKLKPLRRTDLQTLDRRILDEFDKLKVAQQAQLQQLRVPAFQVTHDAVLLERQRRILESEPSSSSTSTGLYAAV